MPGFRSIPENGQTPRRCAGALRLLGLGIAALSLAAPAAEAGQHASGGAIKADVLYHNYCSVCHGDRGDGNSRAKSSLVPPPKDFTTATHLNRETIVAIVSDGKPGTAMVGWKTQLNQKEIEALADYLLATFVGKPAGATPPVAGISGTTAHGGRQSDAAPAPSATPTVKADMSLPIPGGFKGDPAWGRKFYLENCATCHGAKGDGKGPRAYFINPKPRNFVDSKWQSTYNRPALYAAISMGRVGTEMPAWKYVLSEQEMANVTEFVFRQFIQPGKSAQTKPSGG
jgi:mono/diheme cytochrome c family protein